jgi:hypothetical protein
MSRGLDRMLGQLDGVIQLWGAKRYRFPSGEKASEVYTDRKVTKQTYLPRRRRTRTGKEKRGKGANRSRWPLGGNEKKSNKREKEKSRLSADGTEVKCRWHLRTDRAEEWLEGNPSFQFSSTIKPRHVLCA